MVTCRTSHHEKKNPYTFIDLFSGIGGFHLAFHSLGAQCVYAAEWDKYARQTHEHNFKKKSPWLFEDNNELFGGDISKINPADIPDFDILCAGFPCQAFSIAGKRKGFQDTRGTAFFDIVRILKAKKPKAFFLENVRGLTSHDGRKTFESIKNILEKELGYSFHYKIIQACDHGLPQFRARVYMVGFRDKEIPFKFPEPIPLKTSMSDVFGGKCNKEIGWAILASGRGSKITDDRNWDTYMVDGEIRRVKVPEAKKMMGFPETYSFPVSEAQAMKQLGNSVAVPAIRAVAREILRALDGK